MALKDALCKGAGAPILYFGGENGLPPGKPVVALNERARISDTLGWGPRFAGEGSGTDPSENGGICRAQGAEQDGLARPHPGGATKAVRESRSLI
jgi:hypothetical protein